MGCGLVFYHCRPSTFPAAIYRRKPIVAESAREGNLNIKGETFADFLKKPLGDHGPQFKNRCYVQSNFEVHRKGQPLHMGPEPQEVFRRPWSRSRTRSQQCSARVEGSSR
ncbi:hypothetical protein TNCV_3426851 [Trichonephila clavipes]|nr:hypothetical protein TNCV_3426851 [Trichonephila clavipes]